ncbi:MAG: hypothetical protein J7493_10155 [Porphyrobacter sp.]|nr:hypothetical protein [Porphyrobacter sp.]
MTLVDPSAFVPRSAPEEIAGQSSVAGEWRGFVDYALDKSRTLGGPEPVQSALLITGTRLEWPDRLPCRSPTPAVIVDLDQGPSAFSPTPSAQPVAGLPEGLAQLRAAGVVVMWVSAADANRVTAIGDALRSSGLDTAGKDPLLLVRSGEERKQVMRDEANKSVCIIAMAGDRRSDFDELFDYLRDPSSAVGLDAMLGEGWFIVPPPLGEVPAPAN